MAQVYQPPRYIRVQTVYTLTPEQNLRDFDWRTGGQMSIEIYEGFNACWYSRLSRKEYREEWPRDGVYTDCPGFEELVALLDPVPKEAIYPEIPTQGLTVYKPQQGDGNELPYFKAPKLGKYHDGSDDLAARLLQEASVYEKLLRNPHPNLASYLGCVVEAGRAVRLALKGYNKTLYERLQRETRQEFGEQQRQACMDQTEAAAAHLLSLGLAHNDISPSNIMFDDNGQAILIDLDTCAPQGTPLVKGGWITSWKGPVADEGRRFKQSSAACDTEAIQRRYRRSGIISPNTWKGWTRKQLYAFAVNIGLSY